MKFVFIVGLLLSAHSIHPGKAEGQNAREERQAETTTTTTTTTPIQGEINIQADEAATEPGEAEKATARKNDRSAAAESEELKGPDGTTRTFFLIDQKTGCGFGPSMCQAKGAQLALVSAPFLEDFWEREKHEPTNKAWQETAEAKFLNRYLESQLDSLSTSKTRSTMFSSYKTVIAWVRSSDGSRSDRLGNAITVTKSSGILGMRKTVKMEFKGKECANMHSYGIALCERIVG